MVRSAIESGRIDLVKVCFEEPKAWLETRRAVAGLPASDFKEQLVLMMLRSDSVWWRMHESSPQRVVSIEPLMQEPVTSMVKKYLPGQPVGDELLFTKKLRLELAERLEAAIAKRKEAEGGAPAANAPTPPSTPAAVTPTPKDPSAGAKKE